jgi:hypothetical protein
LAYDVDDLYLIHATFITEILAGQSLGDESVVDQEWQSP